MMAALKFPNKSSEQLCRVAIVHAERTNTTAIAKRHTIFRTKKNQKVSATCDS